MTVERDLTLERLKAFQRELFGARTKSRGSEQKYQFFNEVKPLAMTSMSLPAQEDSAQMMVAGQYTLEARAKTSLSLSDPAVKSRLSRIARI